MLKRLKHLFVYLILISVLGFFPQNLQAQDRVNLLTNEEKKEVVNSLNKLLQDYYLFPNVADEIVKHISSKLNSGVYDSIKDPIEFATKLNSELLSISKDHHFFVFFDPDWVAENKNVNSAQEKLEILKKEAEVSRKNNFGFKEVKILEGNIGYINLVSFDDPEYAGETLAATMRFLSNADALIIDLRNNNGGYSDMFQLLCSYFFNPSDQDFLPLVEISLREKGKNTYIQHHILPSISGKRMTNIDLYVLTSYRSFSAAEWTSYILQQRKRATIVGEKTIGGTHPVDRKIINDRFSINIPFGKMTESFTKTDFEGIGVKPDIEVLAKDALITAQIKAVEKLLAKDPKNSKYVWSLSYLKAKQAPLTLDETILKSYVGIYGKKQLVLEGGRLFSQRNDGIGKTELIAGSSDLFFIEGRENYSLKIVKEGSNVVAILETQGDEYSTKTLKEK